MIAVNFGARFFAILLIFFVLATTFYFHDFWNQPAPENAKTLIDALKNLSHHRRAVHDRRLRPRAATERTGLRGHVVSNSGLARQAPRRHGVTLTSFGRIEHLRLARAQAVRGQDLLRRTGRDAGKAWLAAG